MTDIKAISVLCQVTWVCKRNLLRWNRLPTPYTWKILIKTTSSHGQSINFIKRGWRITQGLL